MNYHIVALEISDLIAHFNYFDELVSEAIGKSAEPSEEQTKIRNKSKEHLDDFFAGLDFFDQEGRVLPLSKTKAGIVAKLGTMKNKEIHELVEKLEKDAKKIKKLYLALTK